MQENKELSSKATSAYICFWRFMLFACMGLLLEVTLCAVLGLFRGSFLLRGRTSLWMIFDYGLFAIILMPIKHRLVTWRLPFLARGVVYMLLIYLVEYVSGALFTAVGLRVWNYQGDYQYQLHGHIALAYAPLWYGLGLVAEKIYDRMDACARIFAQGVDR